MDNSAFQKIREIEFPENSPRPLGNIRPRMFRQAMIKDRDNNIYAVYGDRLKKGRVAENAENALPFDIINMRGLGQPDQNGGFSSYRAEVWPGTVANILPSNLFSGGKLTTFTFPSVLTYWKLKVLTDGRTITSAQILVEPDPPASQFLVPSAIPAEAEFLFGASFEGATYRTLGPSNPQVWINQAVVTDKTQPPPPGIPGVDRWYRIYIQ